MVEIRPEIQPKKRERFSLDLGKEANGNSRFKHVGLGLLAIAVFLAGVGLLFHEEILDLFPQAPMHSVSPGLLTAITTVAADSLDPTNNTAATKSRLINIYEGLVGLDENLKIIPRLATSWGNKDPLTWEFHIRRNVTFHNSKPLASQDIVFSFERAKTYPASQLKGILANIDAVLAYSDNRVHIKTKTPDPTLINKILNIFIVPDDPTNDINVYKTITQPVGTGPYKFVSWQQGQELQMESYNNYWGEKPSMSRATIKVVSDKEMQLQLLTEGEVDLISDISSELVSNWHFPEYKIITKPSSGLYFLMFNKNNLPEFKFKFAIVQAINRARLVSLSGNLAHPANSFLLPYTFGYSPELRPIEYNPFSAKTLIAQLDKEGAELTLDLESSQSNMILGKAIKQDLELAGLNLKLNYLNGQELTEKIRGGGSSFYFLGWQFESVDGADFLTDFFHTHTEELGQYSHHNNPYIDAMLDKARSSFQEKERKESLREVLTIIRNDLIGIPLFTTHGAYAVKNGLNWTPRIDSHMYLATAKPTT